MDYQITRAGIICQIDDDGFITLLPPENNGTPEWQAYLRWLEEGNEPLPADEQPTAAEQPAED